MSLWFAHAPSPGQGSWPLSVSVPSLGAPREYLLLSLLHDNFGTPWLEYQKAALGVPQRLPAVSHLSLVNALSLSTISNLGNWDPDSEHWAWGWSHDEGQRHCSGGGGIIWERWMQLTTHPLVHCMCQTPSTELANQDTRYLPANPSLLY